MQVFLNSCMCLNFLATNWLAAAIINTTKVNKMMKESSGRAIANTHTHSLTHSLTRAHTPAGAHTHRHTHACTHARTHARTHTNDRGASVCQMSGGGHQLPLGEQLDPPVNHDQQTLTKMHGLRFFRVDKFRCRCHLKVSFCCCVGCWSSFLRNKHFFMIDSSVESNNCWHKEEISS